MENTEKRNNRVKNINNFVISKFKENFSEEGPALLNQETTFLRKGDSTGLQDIILGNTAQQTQKKTLKSGLVKIAHDAKNNRAKTWNKEAAIIKSLREKPMCYMNADEENTIVIMDKEEYGKAVINKLNNGNMNWEKTLSIRCG